MTFQTLVLWLLSALCKWLNFFSGQIQIKWVLCRSSCTRPAHASSASSSFQVGGGCCCQQHAPLKTHKTDTLTFLRMEKKLVSCFSEPYPKNKQLPDYLYFLYSMLTYSIMMTDSQSANMARCFWLSFVWYIWLFIGFFYVSSNFLFFVCLM